MANEGQANHGQTGRLEAIGEAVKMAGCGLPPVHLWNPPYCGEIDMRIAADGTWFYQQTPIGRPALVKLFASVLKREEDRYYLVTPVEKCGITVDDAPFVAVDVQDDGGVLTFRTNVGDEVRCGVDHALRFERQGERGGYKPYVHVRAGLWAKATRPVYYDLVERGEQRAIDNVMWFGLASGGEFFPMAPADQLEEGADDEA
jgi:hypothetical protein